MSSEPNHFERILQGMVEIDERLEELEESRISDEDLRYVESRTEELREDINEGRATAEAVADWEEDLYESLDSLEGDRVVTIIASGDYTSEQSYEGEDGGLFGFRGDDKGKRRDFLSLVAAATGIGSLAGVGYLASQQGAEQTLDDGTLQEGEWYSFSDVSECLSPSQERTIENASERYTGDGLNKTSYKFEKSGDSRDQGWDIYVADSNGQEEFGKLEGQDIYCEVN